MYGTYSITLGAIPWKIKIVVTPVIISKLDGCQDDDFSDLSFLGDVVNNRWFSQMEFLEWCCMAVIVFHEEEGGRNNCLLLDSTKCWQVLLLLQMIDSIFI